MFFYLDYRWTAGAPPLSVRVADGDEAFAPAEQTLYLRAGVQRLVAFDLPDGGRLLLLGDPVWREEPGLAMRLSGAGGELDVARLYTSVRGHYYWFHLRGGELSCGASFGGLFPVYVHQGAGRAVLCSSAFVLAGHVDAGRPDRRHLLERYLFNYPLFGSTWWSGIRRLGAHCRLLLGRAGAREERSFDIIRCFVSAGGQGSRESLDQLTELFEEECRLFLPAAPFAVSFTGGFDGRTLVAAARAAGRADFFTYSFGAPGEADLVLPAAQARLLGIPHLPVRLDAGYVEGHALESALAFLRLTDHNGNFGRPHYHYAARMLADNTRYIFTGNFGSELFRAMHEPGAMMSEALIRLFTAGGGDAWKEGLSQALDGPAASFFRTEREALIADLEAYFSEAAGLDPNQRFCRFVYEEIFRKYFGPELVMQSQFLCNRTPYLSLRFFEALNGTIWSGARGRLFEKRKHKRLKGQVFYAAFLRRTDRRLYRMRTGKGYSPADVLEPWRRPLLLARVLSHRYLGRETAFSNGVDVFFRRYRSALAGRIRATGHRALVQSGIAHRMEAGAPPDQTIHAFSVAAGWAAAAGVSEPASRDIQERG